jgi:outer membrane lipoprotein-sorting protein
VEKIMEFEELTGRTSRSSRVSNHARLSFKNNGSAVLAFRNSANQKLIELSLLYNSGDMVRIHVAKNENVIAFKKDNELGKLKLSKYGREGSNRFQIYSKELAEKGLKEGEYIIKEPLKSQSEFDFMLYLVEDTEK